MAFQERIDRLVDYVLTLQDSDRCADFITAKGVGEALGIDDRAAGCVLRALGDALGVRRSQRAGYRTSQLATAIARKQEEALPALRDALGVRPRKDG